MKIEFRRNLPHIYAQDAIYSITFRLAGTIPYNIFQEYSELKRDLLKNGKVHLLKNLYNEHIDSYLDSSCAMNDWLMNVRIRDEVVSAINYYHLVHYKIIDYCMMPNHVHLIINTFGFDPIPLGNFLGSIKRHSARKANKILGRLGKFWPGESYDHLIRSRNELAETIDYVIHNPVKAVFVRNWEDWDGTYLNEKYLG